MKGTELELVFVPRVGTEVVGGPVLKGFVEVDVTLNCLITRSKRVDELIFKEGFPWLSIKTPRVCYCLVHYSSLIIHVKEGSILIGDYRENLKDLNQ